LKPSTLTSLQYKQVVGPTLPRRQLKIRGLDIKWDNIFLSNLKL
jgi:hypothetical protein